MTESRQHLRGIARGGALGLVGAVVSAAANFLLVIIVTNKLDKPTAGQFFSGTSLFMIATALAALGTDAGLGRFTARYLVAKRPAAVKACWMTALGTTVGLSTLVAVLIIVFRDSLAKVTGLDSATAEGMLVLLAVGLPAATLMSVGLSATRALGTMRPTVLIDKILRTTGQSAVAMAVLVGGGGLIALGCSWTVPYLVAATLAIAILRSMARRRLVSEGTNDITGVRREFWRFTWPRSIAQLSQMTIQRADIIIIGALISPAAAAVYTAATRFIAFGQFGNQAIQQAIQPRFAHLLVSEKHGVLAEVYRTSTAWGMLISWPMYLAVGAAPTVYLSLFGSGYDGDGQAVVIVMAIAMMIGVASGPVDTMLLMSGRSSLSLINSLVALTIDLVLCFALIPHIGILGAAIAWNAAVVVRCGLGYIQVRQATGLTPLGRQASLAALIPVLCYGLPLTVLSVVTSLTLATYLGALVLLTCLYCAVLWTQRGTLELTALSSLLSRGAGHADERPSDPSAHHSVNING